MFLSTNFKIFRYNYTKVPIKWKCKSCTRNKSSSDANTKTYSHTILFPKTDFPNRSNNAMKDEIQKTAQFSELYTWQRQHLKGSEFVLHDGPPYANGDLHMGHAVNKIIKDICNRSQILQGNRVHYVPGWDCHGLPIELKALQKAKKLANKSEPSCPVNTRQIARNFALETVEKQKEAFRKWGVMAEWQNDIYLTLDKGYIRNQLAQFCKMYKNGLIFRALKPVYWSPSSKTALAEAELEYDPQYKSMEVYVRFPFENYPEKIRQWTTTAKSIHALIWTTTPWTLVANRGICYNANLKYCLVRFSGNEENLYIIGLNLLESLQRVLSVEIVKLAEFEGQELKGCSYRNKLTDKVYSLLESDHVTDSKGTGLVHMAPAHGPEDFLVALGNNMTVECNVDESGRYFGLDSGLNGLYVLKEGQDAVVEYLGDAVLHQGWYTHSYPLDWRTKKPVIVRASQQWFIDTAALKGRALAALKEVRIMPQASADQYRQGLMSQLEKRPYWCISRQRSWGAPIPVIYADDVPIVDERIIENLCNLMDENGPDVWWTCDVKDFLPYDVILDLNLQNKTLSKGKDILDIWLDSGLSWSKVLGGRTADLYVEGVDQFTGWFQSSLLTSVALNDRAPYKSILVHGFVVDEKKRKMSKSIGNVIDPLSIVYGGKNKLQPAFGIDTLRWWVASHGTQHSQIVISNKLLEDCQNEIIRIRNIMKYLLGVISDLEITDFNRLPKLNYFDRYIVNKCYDLDRNIKENYNYFRFNHIVQSVNYFISNIVSGLYCHCVKDRLYCSAKSSDERLSSQLVVHTILILLCKGLSPIMPHLIEEVWQHHPLYERPFFFTQTFPLLSESSLDAAMMDLALDLKKELHSVARNENLKKFIVKIKAGSDVLSKLKELMADGDVLCEILEVSAVYLENDVDENKDWSVELFESERNQCLRCRKFNAEDFSDKCLRCEKVLSS